MLMALREKVPHPKLVNQLSHFIGHFYCFKSEEGKGFCQYGSSEGDITRLHKRTQKIK